MYNSGTLSIKSLMYNEWIASIQWTLERGVVYILEKKVMDEHCAKDDDERDTDCYYLAHISGKMVGT